MYTTKLIFIHLIFFCTQFIYAQTFNIIEAGAVGDGITDNTKIIQDLVDKCSAAKGTIIFPTGTFVTGTIILKSNVHIILSNGAVWKGSPDKDKYPSITYNYVIPIHSFIKKSLIYAENQENIFITGMGTIDGNGNHKNFRENTFVNDSNRPFGLRISNCRNVKIQDITLRNFACWTQHYYKCKELMIKGIKVDGHYNENNDGIDIDNCEDVTVSDCVIDATDDLICLKSQSDEICKNITISNCILSTHCAAIKFGTGSRGGFKNIVIQNIVIKPSTAKEMLTPIGFREGIAGIALEAVDGGYIDNVLINNVVMDSIQTPIFIKTGNRNSVTPSLNNKSGFTKNIILSNIIARHAGKIGSSISGYPGNDVENITLNNISIECRGDGSERDTILTVMENSAAFPSSMMFNCNLPAYGLYMRHVKNIKMNQVEITTEKPDPRTALVLDDAKDVYFSHLLLPVENNTLPIIALNSSNLNIQSLPSTLKAIQYISKSQDVTLNGSQAKYIPVPKTTFNETQKVDLNLGKVLSIDFENLNGSKSLTYKNVKQIKGMKGNGVQLSGVSYIQSNAVYDFTKGISLVFWMKLDDNNKNEYYRIVSQKKAWNDQSGFEVEINPYGKRFNFSGANKWMIDQGLFETIFDTEWHQYAMVLSNETIIAYRDGKIIGRDNIVAMPIKNTSLLTIGASAGLSDFFKGSLDEFTIYDRALNEAEINEVFKK